MFYLNFDNGSCLISRAFSFGEDVHPRPTDVINIYLHRKQRRSFTELLRQLTEKFNSTNNRQRALTTE